MNHGSYLVCNAHSLANMPSLTSAATTCVVTWRNEQLHHHDSFLHRIFTETLAKVTFATCLPASLIESFLPTASLAIGGRCYSPETRADMQNCRNSALFSYVWNSANMVASPPVLPANEAPARVFMDRAGMLPSPVSRMEDFREVARAQTPESEVVSPWSREAIEEVARFIDIILNTRADEQTKNFVKFDLENYFDYLSYVLMKVVWTFSFEERDAALPNFIAPSAAQAIAELRTSPLTPTLYGELRTIMFSGSQYALGDHSYPAQEVLRAMAGVGKRLDQHGLLEFGFLQLRRTAFLEQMGKIYRILGQECRSVVKQNIVPASQRVDPEHVIADRDLILLVQARAFFLYAYGDNREERIPSFFTEATRHVIEGHRLNASQPLSHALSFHLRSIADFNRSSLSQEVTHVLQEIKAVLQANERVFASALRYLLVSTQHELPSIVEHRTPLSPPRQRASNLCRRYTP